MSRASAFLLPLLLAGCQCFAVLDASGSAQQGIVFHLAAGSGTSAEPPVLFQLTVFDPLAANSNPVWAVQGRARVGSVTYGRAPPGMKEAFPAASLEPGRRYAVSVEAGAAGTPSRMSCRGSMLFSVTPDGRVVICSRESSVCS